MEKRWRKKYPDHAMDFSLYDFMEAQDRNGWKQNVKVFMSSSAMKSATHLDNIISFLSARR